MPTEEITLAALNCEEFIAKQVAAIRQAAGDKRAISALSGGVDSAVVTLLGHRALGDRLDVFFVENGLMRKGEAQKIVSCFADLGVTVEVVYAEEKFFKALRCLTCPECKRNIGITRTFYQDVFGEFVRRSGAKILFQGTNFTDVEETVAGIKRQHNVFAEIGIDPEKTFGYQIIEPIIQLRKPAVRAVARVLGLPKEISERPPFPGPALAARIIGEVTPERVEIIRQATAIVEEELASSGAFQYLAILHEDRVTGIRHGQRDFGLQIEVRCWDSEDAVTATPTELPFASLRRIADQITTTVPGVVSVTYNITSKPTSCIEAV